MLINAYGEKESPLWLAASIVGANLCFRGENEYRVTVYVDGYKVGETREHKSSREWVRWLKSL